MFFILFFALLLLLILLIDLFSLLLLLLLFKGESVPENERTTDKSMTDSLSASSSTHNLPSISKTPVSGAVAAAAVSDEERLLWEEEKQKLYQQLDDKVCHFRKCFDLRKIFHSTENFISSKVHQEISEKFVALL